jgi:hypothetical protein
MTAPPRLNTSPRPALSRQTARAAVAIAAVVAFTGDVLVFDDPVGLGLGIWVALLALAMIELAWRDDRSVPREAVAWLAVAVLFATAVAWRSAGELRALDLLATAGALGLAAVTLRSSRASLLALRAGETLSVALSVIASIAAGAIPLAWRDALAREDGTGSGDADTSTINRSMGAMLRPALLAVIVLVVFGALLRGADPIFASWLSLPAIPLDIIIGRLVFFGFLSWIVAGWTRGALLPPPAARNVEPLPFSLGIADVTAVLGALGLLFALFVLAQLGWYFGGEAFLRERTGLTAAAYARSGFFQLVWVVLLVVPVLAGTRAALAPDPAVARRHTILSIPVLVLLGAMILSAVSRMQLYVHYYGLTLDRLYPLVFMGWLAALLAWMAISVLRGRPRPFAAGAVIGAFAAVAALNIMNPHVIVARVDVARVAAAPSTGFGGRASASGSAPIDLTHLASLSGDAAALVVPAVLGAPATDADRCTAIRHLLRLWGPDARIRTRDDRDGAWRWWNAGDHAALRIVRAHEPALRRALHASCAATDAARAAAKAKVAQR